MIDHRTDSVAADRHCQELIPSHLKKGVVVIAAATGFVLLLAGAAFAHRRAGDPAKDGVPVFVALGVASAYLAVAFSQ